MNDQAQPDVGSRIRKLREQRRLSLRALSAKSGLSVNAISRIERGESSPTVASLLRLSGALGVHVGDLFENSDKQATILVRRNRRLRFRGDNVLMESLGVGLPGQILEPFLMTVAAGEEGAGEPCSHSGEEFVHCMKGEIECQVNDEWQRLEAGDSLLFQARQPHRYRNTGLETAVVLLILASPDQLVNAAHRGHLMSHAAEPQKTSEDGM